ncbi:MAG TPA: DUF4236 domain-containing protein [Chthoniobacterales bacterium]|nr:DUF4236 domain-containing protein [Chthoniobacterales bacterium]
MGFRFRKRIRLGKGLYLNVGKRGITSISKRAGRVTVTAGKRGVHETARIGGGLPYSTGSGCLLLLLAIPPAVAAIWLFVR